MAIKSNPFLPFRSAATLAIALGLLPVAGHAGDIQAMVHDAGGNALADAVVVALPESSASQDRSAQSETIVVDQIDKEFVPYVQPMQVGTQVHFPNRDGVRHHVYSFSKPKRFELPLYIGDPATPIVFDKPGVVILGCNIHDWMISYLYIASSPYFARTGSDGKAMLRDLPAGRYTLRAWHPRLDGDEEKTAREEEIPAEGVVEAQWTLPLKPDFRIPRAPIPGVGGY